MDRLNNLRSRKDHHARLHERQERMYPIDKDSVVGVLYHTSNRLIEDYLDREIRAAEKEAFDEQIQEAVSQMAQQMKDAGKQAGAEIANAIA